MPNSHKTKPIRHLFVTANGVEAGGNVVLNFTGAPKRELALIGNEYFDAAKVLIERLAQKRGYSDLEAYPIVFLYRHALELYFKALLSLGNDLSGLLGDERLEIDVLKVGHRLTPSLDYLEHLFGAVGWNWDFGVSGLTGDEFREIIREFESIDPTSDAFRYPVKKDGTASVERHFVFSPVEMSKILDPILTTLSGACAGLEEYHSQLAEAAHEAQQDAYESYCADYYDPEFY